MSAAIAEPMSEPRVDSCVLGPSTAVMVYAKDPISRTGVAGQLLGDPGIDVVAPSHGRTADVAVVVADLVDDEVLGVIRSVRRSGPTQVVVVAGRLDTASLLSAVEAGAAGFLLRPLANRERLSHVIAGVRQGGTVLPPGFGPGVPAPQDGSASPSPPAPALNARELEVLRLLAEGCDTAEIAQRLAYSEPTIKNVIQRLFERLQVRNRPHAVAVALRAGLI